MRNTRIVVNGRTYDSLDDVPESMRGQLAKMLEDKDGNGKPDFFEAAGDEGSVVTKQEYVVDGKTYTRLEDLPPEVRRLVAGAAQFDGGRPPGRGIYVSARAALILGLALVGAVVIVVLLLR